MSILHLGSRWLRRQSRPLWLVLAFGPFLIRTAEGAQEQPLNKPPATASPGLLAAPGTRPDVDLEVMFIERLPKYPRYDLRYVNRVFEDEYVPYEADVCVGLAEGQTSQTKRWPDEGERVTFVAHIRNRGKRPITSFSRQWLMDNTTAARDVVTTPLAPSEQTTERFEWKWRSGRHVVELRCTAAGDECPLNDRIIEATDALTLQTAVEREYMEEFLRNSARVKKPTTDSFLHWLQRHIAEMNRMFQRADSPTRIRLDRILLFDKAPSGDPLSHAQLLETDGRFPDCFKAGDRDLRLGGSGYYNADADIDYGLLHEWAHQFGLIDLYRLDVSAESNKVNGQSYRAVSDLMRDCSPAISVHTALALRSWEGKRRGYFGQYLYDIPAKNALRFTSGGKPVAGAKVSVFQKTEVPTEEPREQIRNKVKFAGVTDANGEFVLPNVPMDPRKVPPTETGNVLRPNPFGYISNHGENGVFLIRVEDGRDARYAWIDITRFNEAYWQGRRDVATYTLPLD